MTECVPEVADPTVDVLLTFTDTDTDDVVELSIGWDCSADPEEPWWWTSLTWPFFDYRYGYAPTSAWLPGDVLLSATPGSSTIPIGLAVHTDPADGQAGLTAARAVLESAFRAGDLTLGFVIDGVTVETWQADPARINWGQVSVDTLGMYAQEGAVVVPVNPVEAT